MSEDVDLYETLRSFLICSYSFFMIGLSFLVADSVFFDVPSGLLIRLVDAAVTTSVVVFWCAFISVACLHIKNKLKVNVPENSTNDVGGDND